MSEKSSDTATDTATAFAPATVGNVAVGFDILGFALEGPGDRVTVRRIDEPTVRIDEITGVVTDLPTRPDENTATVGLCQLIDELELDRGFEVSIDKGIPLGSGMGGSAASAVGAIVAANRLLDDPLTREEMLGYALLGESVASGDVHGDNVTPCLFGGLTLTRSLEPLDVVEIPVPDAIRCIVAYPHQRIDTQRARKVIPGKLPLKSFVEQSANLAGFIAGCYREDIALIERSLADMLIEPHRAPLIQGFSAVRQAALASGALGCSISGSGPSIFAWCHSAAEAEEVESAMLAAFDDQEIEADAWRSGANSDGARIE
jgi:homoserine kinase